MNQPPPSANVIKEDRDDDLCGDAPHRDSKIAFPIVGIVASAGGLNAFKKFFTTMSADSGMAFVLVPHLDPSHESLMVDLLSKLTSMPVVEAKQGMKVQVNSVYVIPPKNFLAIANGLLQTSEPSTHPGWRTSIDFFLRSLAQDQGERAIGIVLSGTGSHGALGVREIKLAGGMVMAQEPGTAEYDQMPKNAIQTGVIDCVLPPDQMPAALVKYVEQPYLSSARNTCITPEQSTDILNQVLTILKSGTKYDFRPYRKPMVLRRIQRRMGLAHIDSMTQYLELLQQQPEEVTALYKDLLISVTAFFRDSEAFRILAQKIIPALLTRQTDDWPIRVWVPGCATGEEAYSIAMLLFEGAAEAKVTPNVQIFASDIDAEAIDIARNGIYPASITGDVSADRIKRFFVMVDDSHFQIDKQLRESVVFSHQNLIGDAPFSKLDLISCRNLLIYLEPEMQQKVISLFHFALVSDGYLLLGPSETVGRLTDLFEIVSKKWRIYRRIGVTRLDMVSIPLTKIQERSNLKPHHPSYALHRKSLKELTEQLVLNDYAPAVALINRSLEVLYVTGPLVNYLEFPRGEITKELLTMARPGLRAKLRSACKGAIRDGKTIIETDARVRRNGRFVPCSITVRPLTEPKEAEELMLVVFQDHETDQALLDVKSTRATDASHGNNGLTLSETERSLEEESRLVLQLEFELKSMSEELHSTIEEMESSNEELKTSNEEIMSMNEELQSVNEELETSKEELQSLNEELITINGQLEDKVVELDKVTDDLMNLMSSTEIATIFLDGQLKIKRFTPPTKALLNLLATDIGRPLQDIAPRFADDQMLVECQEVLDKLTPVEREIETDEPRYFLRRILPYRTTEHATGGTVGGVVITFVDLTQRKLAETVQHQINTRHSEELHESAERLQAILGTAADAIITFDLLGQIDSVNLATEALFNYPRSQLIGQNISLLLPFIKPKQHDTKANNQVPVEFTHLVGNRREMQARRNDGSTFFVDLAISRVDHLDIYTAILRDISLQKQLQTHVLEIATDEQRRIGQELHDGTQQELTGLSLICGALCELLNVATRSESSESRDWVFTPKDYQELQQNAAKLSLGLKKANHHVNRLSHGIMPVQIDAEGLRSALAELAAEANNQAHIKCELKFSGSNTVGNNTVATQLYRIAQESLNNAIKHSRATEILIFLSQQVDQVILEISDNGIGLGHQRVANSRAKGSGIGLRIMEYRANMLGGSLEIDQNQKRGTTVRCIVPTLEGLL
jgi:two-component system CheB/CheR fusion protein